MVLFTHPDIEKSDPIDTTSNQTICAFVYPGGPDRNSPSLFDSRRDIVKADITPESQTGNDNVHIANPAYCSANAYADMNSSTQLVRTPIS